MITPIRITEDEFGELMEDNGGICRSCSNRQGGCEPDARYYPCEACGANEVFGAEELLIRGEIEFVEDGEELDDFSDLRDEE